MTKAALLLLAFTLKSAEAQVPTTATLKACWVKTVSSRWCVPADGTSAIEPITQPSSGYCCVDESTDEKCTDGDSYKCTGNNKGGMVLPLWSTYWPGMTTDICGGSNELTATSELQSMTITPVIETRVADGTYTEACYWTITPEFDAFHDTAEIYIYLDASTTANMYIFSGDQRTNATWTIENDVATSVGAPIRVPVSSGAIVTLQTTGGSSRTGEGTFSYKVVGDYYRWYEKPFIGLHVASYYLFVIFIACVCVPFQAIFGVLPLLLVLSPVLLLVGGPITCCLIVICGGVAFGRRKKSKGRARKPATRRSAGRGPAPRGKNGGLLTYSPPSGKGKGPPPKQLGP